MMVGGGETQKRRKRPLPSLSEKKNREHPMSAPSPDVTTKKEKEEQRGSIGERAETHYNQCLKLTSYRVRQFEFSMQR